MTSNELKQLVIKQNNEHWEVKYPRVRTPKKMTYYEAYDLLRISGNNYHILSTPLKTDKDLILLAIQNGCCPKYLSPDVRNKSDLMLMAVRQNGMHLQYCSDSVRDDPIVVWASLCKNKDALQFASQRFQESEALKFSIQGKM